MNNLCSYHQDHPAKDGHCATCSRMRVERKIVRKTIAALLGAGYQVMVNDGEEDVTDFITDAKEIEAAMFSTDEDWLWARMTSAHPTRFVRFIYGNDGPDVMNDYSTGLEDILTPVNAYADSLAA